MDTQRGRHSASRRPPPALLRLLGPFVILLTLAVLATGVALLLVSPALRPGLLFLHKASFVLWLGAMSVHVLGHLADTARLAPRDWMRRTRRDVTGAGLRQWAIDVSLVCGLLLAVMLVGRTGSWLGLAGYAGH